MPSPKEAGMKVTRNAGANMGWPSRVGASGITGPFMNQRSRCGQTKPPHLPSHCGRAAIGAYAIRRDRAKWFEIEQTVKR
jgi:hypothetical protein